MDEIFRAILANPVMSIFFIFIICLIISIMTVVVIAGYKSGRKVTFFGIEIDSRQENLTINEEKKNSFAIIDIMKAHDLWSNFKGTFYAWNPSWQTELVTNPSEWGDVHVRRYLDKDLERVVYIVSKEPVVKNEYSKFFYFDGFKEFLTRFAKNNPEIYERMKVKTEVYVEDKLPSNLTFFIGCGKEQNKDIALLLINEAPFCQYGTPTLVFHSENKDVIREMQSMFHSIMNKNRPIPLDEIINS